MLSHNRLKLILQLNNVIYNRLIHISWACTRRTIMWSGYFSNAFERTLTNPHLIRCLIEFYFELLSLNDDELFPSHSFLFNVNVINFNLHIFVAVFFPRNDDSFIGDSLI